jgi:cytoskeletal protein CcmA (bactofilin family)
MGDVSVSKDATAKLGHVEGDLRVAQAARIEPEDKVIQVAGRVICEGDAEFHGSLSCSEFSARHGKIRVQGDLNAKGEVKVEDGQLTIDGSLEAATVSVDKTLWIGGNARADEFDVGGVLEVRGTISSKKVDVGGSFKVQGAAEVDEVGVGGTVDIAGMVKSAKLDVGGMARIGGGEVSKDVDVGGKFESTKPLKFSKIDVGGLATLVEGGEGGDVDVGGKFESKADLSFNSLDVGGMASINGNGKGVEVDVGGLLRVSGSLTLVKGLDIGGRAYIGAELRLDSLEVGGSMEADLIIAQKSIEVRGDLKTIKGTKGDTIELGHGSRASGPIVAREVSVGHGGRVEDIYSETLEMEHGSRARNLYFREGIIEAGVHVEGEVLYTDTIEASPDVRFAKPASKVNDLPKAPL